MSQVMNFRKSPRNLVFSGEAFSTGSAGFTLIELCAVIFIMGIIASVAFPQLLPLLVFSEVDAEARRLANYGSGAIAEAALFGSELTVYIDLDNQEYYTVHMVYPDNSDDLEESVDQLGLFNQFRSSGEHSSTDISEMLSAQSQGDKRLSSQLPEGFDTAEADAQMYDKFNQRQRQILYARAKNVKQDESFLSEIGPLFETEFTLSLEEPYEEELYDPILERYRMPEEIRIESVSQAGGTSSTGIVSVPISPLGLIDDVVISIRNQDGTYFSVLWNPLTGRGVSQEGKLS